MRHPRHAPVNFALAALALGPLAVALAGAPAHAQTPTGASVLVVKAGSHCFSATVRVAGHVVLRAEAIVNLDADGYRISEVLVVEAEQVKAGQTLAKLTLLGGGPSASAAVPSPAAGPGAPGAAGGQRPASLLPLPPPMGAEPLFRIIVGNELELEVEVPSVQLPKLDRGHMAQVQLEDGREATGRVRLIHPEIDRKTQLGNVRLTIEPDPSIRAGMFARASIYASRNCGISVPRSAVHFGTDGTSVQVVRNNVIETRG